MESPHEHPSPLVVAARQGLPLCTLLRERKADIVLEWEHAIRRALAAGAPAPLLAAPLPELLERMAALAEGGAVWSAPSAHAALVARHVPPRPSPSATLQRLVTEFALLRDCILGLWHGDELSSERFTEVRLLHDVVERSMWEFWQGHVREGASAESTHGPPLPAARLAEPGREPYIGEFARRALAANSPETLFVDAVEVAARALEVPFASVMMLDAHERLVVEAAHGWPASDVEQLAGTVHERSQAGLAVRQRAPVVVTGLDGDPRFDSAAPFSKHGVASGLNVPIARAGVPPRVLGVLCCHSPARQAFGAAELEFLEALARVLALALREAEPGGSAAREGALAAEAPRKERAPARTLRRRRAAVVGRRELLSAERRARAEAERALAVLDALLAAAPVGIAFIDTKYRYVRINDALAAMDGVPYGQHVGRTVGEVLGATGSAVQRCLDKVIQTGEPALGVERVVADSPSNTARASSFLSNYFPVVRRGGHVLGVGCVVVDITERKRMEEALRQRELEFRSLADNIPQLAWMADAIGKVLWYNRRWFEYTGRAPNQGADLGWKALLHPEHVQRVTQKLRRCIERQEVWEDTFPLRGANGDYRWFLSRAVPIRGPGGEVVRWFGTSTDVTEQRILAEVASALSCSLDARAYLRRVTELAVPALADLCIAQQLEHEHVTQVEVAPSGGEAAALARQLWSPGPRAPLALPLMKRVFETKRCELHPVTSEQVLAELAGSPDTAQCLRRLGMESLVVAPVLAHGRLLGNLVFIMSGSGRKYARRDLDVLLELAARTGLALANARLYQATQDAVRVREQILALVSHDLKNPLHAIQSAASLLMGHIQADASERRPLEVIQRSAHHMGHLIGDLLDVASIDAGRLALSCRAERCAALVVEALELQESTAREKGVSLRRCEPLALEPVWCDRDRVLQVFGNLLGNALKFCPAQSEIVVSATTQGHEVRFAIADRGPGIPPQDLPHVFERYWSGRQHANKGSGQGLYISKGIIEAHGGRLWLDSQPGVGTVAHFTLPIATAKSG